MLPSQTRNEKIVALVQSGESIGDVARAFKISRQRVSQITHAAGLHFKQVQTHQRLVPRNEHIVRRAQEGASDWRIAAELGLTPGTVQKVRIAAGVYNRNYRPPGSFTHGKSGYQRGCRCEVCTLTNRHSQHVLHRGRPIRSDRLPCPLCC